MPPKVDKTQRKPFKRAFAKSLRTNATEPERRLWARLRAGRLGRLQFRRQQVIGSYIADFFCASAKLIVELDGGQHGDDEVALRDDARRRFLESRGYRVLRFWNTEFLKDPEAVLDAIWRAAQPSP